MLLSSPQTLGLDSWGKKLILRIKIKKAIFTLCSLNETQCKQPSLLSCHRSSWFQEGLLLPALASVRHHSNNKITTMVGTEGNSPTGLLCRPPGVHQDKRLYNRFGGKGRKRRRVESSLCSTQSGVSSQPSTPMPAAFL